MTDNQARARGPAPGGQDLLVSVGIPTYGRPAGVDRTLRLITGQTWRNLEIIVSDNASPGPEVQEVLGRWSADPRVRVVRQPRNLGASANFDYVLRAATGPLFMWASDDDEWDPRFVEACVPHAAAGVSVMPQMQVLNRASGERWATTLPELGGRDRAADMEAYLRNMQPSMIYGLHPRETLLRCFRTGERYDFADCAIVARLLLRGGLRTLPGDPLYCAGIDDAQYRIKYADPGLGRFDFGPFVREMAWQLVREGGLSWGVRRRLMGTLMATVADLMRHHEGTRDTGRRIRSELLRAVFQPRKHETA